jgi:HEAT repeat protein
MVTPMARWWSSMAVLTALLLSGASAWATVWPSSHQRIADALTHGDVSERRGAAAKLTTLPPKLGKELARQALRDSDIEVRLFAARAAAELGVERAGAEVTEWLSDRDVRLRVAACELIEASPTPESVQALARVLGDAQAPVRKAAAAAMGSSGLADAVSPLLGYLDDTAAPVRLEVVRALGRLGDARAVVPLVSKLQDQEADVRREAARALGQLGDTRATSTLMLALQDQSVNVRVQALEALGKLRASEATTAIAALLTGEGETVADAQGAVRDGALRALGRIGTPEAVKLLIDALEREGPLPLGGDEPAPVRDALVQAGRPAIDGLTATLGTTPSQRLASSAALALGALRASEAFPAIVRASQRGSVSLDAALLSLASIGDKRALAFVLEHLGGADVRVRQVAVRAASDLLDPADRDGRAVDVVRDRVLDLTAPVGERIALVRLLGRTGSPRAEPVLLSLSKSRPVGLRIAVIEAFGELGAGGPKVHAALFEALDHPSSQRMRMAAATSLGRIGKDSAARQLLHRLGVSAEQDRGAIGIALSGALSRSRDTALVAQVRKEIRSAPSTARDALIEGLGRMNNPRAAALLVELSKSSDPDDRRKVAEALGGHASGEKGLVTLLRDPDPAVRANAAWSLGRVGSSRSLTSLGPLLRDLDVAVAGNAALALAKLAARHRGSANAKLLCGALNDYRPYVRANALAGMRIAGVSCDDSAGRRLLRRDRAWRVRYSAAGLLRSRAASSKDSRLDVRALARCASEDRDAAVAARCREDSPQPAGAHDVLVYVVPDGETAPVPRAAFALVLADGAMRLGVADRRGALFEEKAPNGRIELAVPAALVP